MGERYNILEQSIAQVIGTMRTSTNLKQVLPKPKVRNVVGNSRGRQFEVVANLNVGCLPHPAKAAVPAFTNGKLQLRPLLQINPFHSSPSKCDNTKTGLSLIPHLVFLYHTWWFRYFLSLELPIPIQLGAIHSVVTINPSHTRDAHVQLDQQLHCCGYALEQCSICYGSSAGW